MKTRSCKAKGRRLMAELREAILKAFPELSYQDVIVMPTSVGGDDLKLSAAARRLFPFSVEGKNREKFSIWAAQEQAEANCNGNPPAVVFRRNRTPPWVAIPLPILLNLLQRVQSTIGPVPTHRIKGKYDKPIKGKDEEMYL